MSIRSTDELAGGPVVEEKFSNFELSATDVTGTHVLEAYDMPRGTPAGEAAMSLASRMSLPINVPWALRNDQTGGYLDDDREIGDQIEAGSRVTVTPKTHLG